MQCIIAMMVSTLMFASVSRDTDKTDAALVQLQKATGVAEHPDHIETVEKELKIIAEYDDQLEMLKKYFPE